LLENLYYVFGKRWAKTAFKSIAGISVSDSFKEKNEQQELKKRGSNSEKYIGCCSYGSPAKFTALGTNGIKNELSKSVN
jgi:hypothetical protein